MKIEHKNIVGQIRSESTISRLTNLAIAGLEVGAEKWYSEGLKEVETLAKLTGNPVSDWALLLSVYSPRCSVSRAARLAWMHFVAPEHQPTGCMRKIYETALKYRPLGFLNGKKTDNFRRAILTGGTMDQNDFVFDTWMAKAFGVDQSIGYRNWSYGPMIETMFDVRNYLAENDGINLTIDELQASIWAGQLIVSNRDISKRALIPQDVIDSAIKYGEIGGVK